MYDCRFSFDPFMMLLKDAIMIDFLFQVMKWKVTQLQKYAHDSIQPSRSPLNQNLSGMTKVNANSLHLEASSAL